MSRGLLRKGNKKRKTQTTNKNMDSVMEKRLIVQLTEGKESSVEEENVNCCIDMAVKYGVLETKKSSHVQRLIK